jgi:hypothetical protein
LKSLIFLFSIARYKFKSLGVQQVVFAKWNKDVESDKLLHKVHITTNEHV